MNNVEDARAMCPYYQRIKDREIQCECCVNKARQIFVFRNAADAIRHKRAYCDRYTWAECPYASMLTTLWTMDFRRQE